jgi:hypothetical protein
MARYDDDRIRRDQAGVGPSASDIGNLVPIDDLDGFRIAAGEPDIRGWNVYTVSGREIGEVDDLLVDARTCEVVMLDIDLKESDGHAEIPIRNVQLDRSAHRVLMDSGDLDGFTRAQPRAALSDVDRTRLRAEVRDLRSRDIRYSSRADALEETVVERRPVVVEETIVRRRVVDPDEVNRT